MIIPRWTSPPLGFFSSCAVFFINWVTRYVLKHILVLFETNLGYVLGEIFAENAIHRIIQFQEIRWER